MSRSTISRALVVVFVSACTMGPRLESFAPSASPAGIELSLELERSRLAGELLAVADTSLLLAVSWPKVDYPQLVQIPLRRVHQSTSALGTWRRWSDGITARYRPLSRYPQGVSAELKARLAAAYGVDSIPWIVR